MFLPRAAVHENVVEEHNKLPKILTEDSIHEGLESGRGVPQAEGHPRNS